MEVGDLWVLCNLIQSNRLARVGEFCLAVVVLILHVAAAHYTGSAACPMPISGCQRTVYNVGILQLSKLQLKRRFRSGIMQNRTELHIAKAVCMRGIYDMTIPESFQRWLG